MRHGECVVSSVKGAHTLLWFTTPAQLRKIAARMEEFWEQCAPGESKVVEIFCAKDDWVLEIAVDQHHMVSPAWQRSQSANAVKPQPANDSPEERQPQKES